jgi:ATP/maltotriose-dependent transcriptional regulator MalT
LNRRPLLRLQQCGFLSILMELSDVKEILAGIEKNGKADFSGYSDDKRIYCQDLMAYFKCMLHISYCGEASVVAQFEELRHKICPQSPLLVGSIETQIVFILISKGDLTLAESFLARLSEVPLSSSGRLMRKKIYHAQARALIAKHRGRLREAEAIILQLLQIFKQQGYGDIPMSFLLHRQLGNIFYHQNKLEQARACAAGALKYCEYFGLIDEIKTGNELQLQLHLAAKEYTQAVQCVRQMQAYSIKLGMPQIAASADACAARVAIDQGNPAAAELWARRRNLQMNEPFSLLFAMECLTQARLFYARKAYGDAAHMLETLRERCLKRGLMELVLQIDVLQSAALHAVNHHEKAVARLTKALAFAETEGYLRPFINDADLIAPVLRRIADAPAGDRPSGHFEKIIAACNIPPHKPAVAPKIGIGEHEELTQREVEILALMAQGLQNKEIAQKVFIAVSTVKSHVSNILVKLDVRTRTQAILKIREMHHS